MAYREGSNGFIQHQKTYPSHRDCRGIGSGKSTVAAEFARLGCTVLDADRMAHDLLADPNVQQELVSFFGAGILDDHGRIDRRKLADRPFPARNKCRRSTESSTPG